MFSLCDSASEDQLFQDSLDARAGTRLVRLAAGRPRDANTADDRTGRLDGNTAAYHERIRHMTYAGLRTAALGLASEGKGIDPEGHRCPRLASCRVRCVCAGEAIAQQHLNDAETIDHSDGCLITPPAAIGERCTRKLKRFS